MTSLHDKRLSQRNLSGYERYLLKKLIKGRIWYLIQCRKKTWPSVESLRLEDGSRKSETTIKLLQRSCSLYIAYNNASSKYPFKLTSPTVQGQLKNFYETTLELLTTAFPKNTLLVIIFLTSKNTSPAFRYT